MKKQAAVFVLALCMCAGCSTTSNDTAAGSQKVHHSIFSSGGNFGGAGSINKGAGTVGR
jgi:hypothetical protein